MKKIIVLLILCLSKIFAAVSVEELNWANGETFLNFLYKNSLPLSLYYNLEREDQELVTEILSDTKFYILKNDKNELEQVLIPISDDLQIHIYKDKDNKYTLNFSPISYESETKILKLKVQTSAYVDVLKQSASPALARAMVRAYRGSVDFINMQKDDEVILYYEQKRRLGNIFGDIKIKMASVQINKKAHNIYFYNDTYYNELGKEIESFLLAKPVEYTRISSHFSPARFHPVLKRYRAHLGVDYAAPTGTPVKSAGNGKITFVGTKGGYGKVVQVKHDSGYMTLYAHLSRFGKIKTGQSVKKGQVIAYVGSTGMSTGPHLHFGLYLNNKAINPLSVVKITKEQLKGQEKQNFVQAVKEYESFVENQIQNENFTPIKEEKFDSFIAF
ncbi:peptidoglycan DD-metalloendopeptidase family protein [Campylobacter sp. CCS1377]|uniref:Peptidoglycan DD-metalloendopeptidase family protein n=1 Tax=Campylobacter sp. CCS1377 TaxID=3158229 RepID=A0AAU7E6B7_9BACT